MTESAEPEEATDVGMVVALISLTLVGVAVLASQFPFGRFIAAGIAVVGVLGGLASLGAEGKARLAAAGAVFLHVLVLVVVFFAPSVLNLDSWRPVADAGPHGPQAITHGSGEMTPIQPDTWIDANTTSWEFKDVRVTVRSAFVGPVELIGPKDAKRNTKESYFHLLVRVSNSGVERQIDLSGWAIGQGLAAVKVTDAAGKPFGLVAFEGPWQPEQRKPTEHIFPGKTADVHMLFALPSPKVDSIRVKLPGGAFGMPDESVKFQIGSGLLARNVLP